MNYTVEQFIDTLLPKWTEAEFDDQRYEENSVQGSGNNIPVELASPKWRVYIGFTDLTRDESMFLETKLRKLNGQQGWFMIYDPRRRYPKMDPAGSIIGSNNVQVNSIPTDRQSLSVKGLTAGYVLSQGDKGQITFAGGDRNYFFEFSESATANGSGVISGVQVWPPVPLSISANAVINLKKPACKVSLSSKSIGRSSSHWATGARIEAMERN